MFLNVYNWVEYLRPDYLEFKKNFININDLKTICKDFCNISEYKEKFINGNTELKIPDYEYILSGIYNDALNKINFVNFMTKTQSEWVNFL